jgi:hypothetical protein
VAGFLFSPTVVQALAKRADCLAQLGAKRAKAPDPEQHNHNDKDYQQFRHTKLEWHLNLRVRMAEVLLRTSAYQAFILWRWKRPNIGDNIGQFLVAQHLIGESWHRLAASPHHEH